MKKSLLTVGLSLAMVLTMATPAFAANTNGDGGIVDKPGHPVYDGVNIQEAGASFNAATATSADGTTWQVANDDDTDKTAVDKTADINVWAKVVDSGSKVYKVDLAWGAMKFEYKDASNQWDTATHTYAPSTDHNKGWTEYGFTNGTNNKVTVTNHSNNGINAAFAYRMEGTAFNKANGLNNVIGNFFDTSMKAATAAKVLVDTFTDANGTVNDGAVPNKLVGSKVALPTADAYNSGASTPTTITDNKTPGARTSDVFFAFSGTPDSGKGKDLETFRKVGVITVTVTPNNDASLNQAPYVAAP